MKEALIIIVFLRLIAVGSWENAQAAAVSANEQPKASLLTGRDCWPNTPSLPSAEQIIERYYQAIGGRERLARLQSLQVTGTRQVPATGEQEPFELLKGLDGKMISTAIQKGKRESGGKFQFW